MAYRKLQLYITEEQYTLLKQRAGDDRSLAQVVRDLIEASARPADPTRDAFYAHVMSRKSGSGKRESAERAKRQLYRKPR